MDFAQLLHDLLSGAETRLKAVGDTFYAETADKLRAKADELRPLLAGDARAAEAKALEIIHTLFGA